MIMNMRIKKVQKVVVFFINNGNGMKVVVVKKIVMALVMMMVVVMGGMQKVVIVVVDRFQGVDIGICSVVGVLKIVLLEVGTWAERERRKIMEGMDDRDSTV